MSIGTPWFYNSEGGGGGLSVRMDACLKRNKLTIKQKRRKQERKKKEEERNKMRKGKRGMGRDM